MKYGLAKIHWVQFQLGLEPDATFVGAPDATVTRNIRRWQSGIGYGGKLAWGDGQQKLVFLDSMANACGMLVGGLETIPTMDSLVESTSLALDTKEIIDDVPIEWDFAVSNHFIDLFRYKPVDENADTSFRYVFIIHGSVPELKGDNDTKFGFGLYRHKSEILRNMTEEFDTPFGKTWILTEDNASEYLRLNDFACELSRKKRSKAAEAIFGDFTEICNPIHQGLLNMNEHLLGCQNTKDKSKTGFLPIALRSDLPAYLVSGRPNFDEDIMEHLGFTKRAEKYNVDHRAGHESEKVFSNPRELEFTYRGREVVRRALDLRMCDIVARLMPRVVLKV
jgi:hypothetical protein